MIENELKRMFPGIQFHHLDDRKIDVSGREGLITRSKANLHNLAHSTYDASKNYKTSVELKHKIRRETEQQTGETSEGEARELAGANRSVDEARRGVINTNRALPNNLRGRHTR